MAVGFDVSPCFKLLLLEIKPESLAAARNVWSGSEIVARTLYQSQGVADQISREKIQMVLCDLVNECCPGFEVLQQIRRVHPNLPLVAVLPDHDFSTAISAFRNGVDDVLVHPLNNDVLLNARNRTFGRKTLDVQLANTQQAAKRSLDDLVLLKAVGETTRTADDLQKLLNRIVDLIQSALDVDIASLMLVDDEGALKMRSAYGLPEDVRENVTIAPGEGVSGYVLEHGEPVLIND